MKNLIKDDVINDSNKRFDEPKKEEKKELSIIDKTYSSAQNTTQQKEEQKSFDLFTNENQKPENELSLDIVRYLNLRKINLVKIIEDTRNEFNCIVSINTTLGKNSLFLVARNKKSVNEHDLLASYQKSIDQKMPCLLIHNGKLTKKAEEVREQYKNLLKVEKI
jgi:hypothetical protein